VPPQIAISFCVDDRNQQLFQAFKLSASPSKNCSEPALPIDLS